jgi:hypothetical protein
MLSEPPPCGRGLCVRVYSDVLVAADVGGVVPNSPIVSGGDGDYEQARVLVVLSS